MQLNSDDLTGVRPILKASSLKTFSVLHEIIVSLQDLVDLKKKKKCQR